MKKLLLIVMLTAILASVAEAQQTSEPRVADLVQAGKIRVGIHSFYTKDSRTGELRAVSTGIIFLDIARILGARIGVEVLPVWHPTIPEMLTCLTAGECDVGFMGPDPSRAGVDFSPPFIQLDYTFLVPTGSSIQRIADADRPNVRVAVVRDHASTLTLSRIFKHAPTDLRRDSRPNFRTPAQWTGRRICVGPRRAPRLCVKASGLTGLRGPLRRQPRRDGGTEGANQAACLHHRIRRTRQGLRIGAASDRTLSVARTPGGTSKDKLKGVPNCF